MARTKSGHRGTLPLRWRLLLLPVRLLFAIAGWSLRLVFSFRAVRLAAYLLLAILAVLVIEDTALFILLRHISTRAMTTVLGTVDAASLVVLSWGVRRIARRRRLRVRRFESLLALTPTQFEREVGRLLHDLGYRDVEHVGGAGDLAADLRCRDRGGRTVVVQCKRYAPGRRVRSGEVQAFIGMMTVHHQAERGIFVTTAEFTQPALQLARQHGVELFDGPRLSRLVRAINADIVHGIR